MEQNISQLLDVIVQQVQQRGNVFIQDYMAARSRIVRFFDSRNEKDYDRSILNAYLDCCLSEFESNAIGINYFRFQKRVVRMLNSLAENGSIDFSSPPKDLKYPVSEESMQMIASIYDQNHIKEKRRNSLLSPMRHFFWYIETIGKSPTQVNDSIVLDFLLEEVPAENKGPKKHIYQCVRYITKYLETVIGADIRFDYSKLKSNCGPSRLIPPFTEDEINKMLRAIDTSTPVGKRNYAIIELAYSTGLRCIDIVNLKRTDIDWNSLEIKVIQKKTATPVVSELNGETANAISDYILSGRPESSSPYVFVSCRSPFEGMSTTAIQTMFETVCESAEITKIPGRSFHSLRRTFEVILTAKGIPLETVSSMAGHKSIESDKPYLTFNRDQTSFIAMDFIAVPINKGVYSKFKV